MAAERLRVDVLSVEEGAIDGHVEAGKQRRQVEIVDADTCQRPHGGLYGLRVEDVHRVCRAQDVRDAEPVGHTADGAHIAGILHAVECQTEVGTCHGVVPRGVGELEERHHLLRCLHEAGAVQLVGRDDASLDVG